MRFSLLLLLALIATVLLTLFPETAQQTLRVEAFGWVFETKQGAFTVALLVLLFAAWLLRIIIGALLAGPGQMWRSITLNSKKREEQRLQKALADMINMHGDLGRKALQRKYRIVPSWLGTLLATLATEAADQRLERDKDTPLRIALAARLATSPHAARRAPPEQRKLLLQAWLDAFPQSPLARMRMAEMLEEEGQWKAAAELWEALDKEGLLSSERSHARLAQVWLQLAETEPDYASLYLQKAFRLQPERLDLALRLGRALIAEQERQAAIKLWWKVLETHADMAVAGALLEQLADEPLQHYKKLDRRPRHKCNTAHLWLKAELAHRAGLDGLARDQIQVLTEEADCREAWLSLARWHMEAGNFDQACQCFNRVL